MKNVYDHLEKWRRFYADRCTKHVGGYAKIPVSCYCQTMAQVQSHIECVVPDDYQRYELDDFNGIRNGEVLVKPHIVLEARRQLVSYCWQGIEEGEDYDLKTWWGRSIMEKRHRNGHSLIIYGNPWASGTTAGVKTFKQPLGRTLLAAIVMKEAIRMRARPGHMADTYAWVSYTRLYDKLMSKAKDNNDFNDEIEEYQYADWLCVDGFEVERQNEATRAFKAKVLDAFFDERMSRNLPNVLVFQDDLSRMEDIRQEFGLSVNTLINSSKTTRVKLLESK